MCVFVNKNTHAVVQGATGKQGLFHTKLMIEYGTKIVAGVTPGKGGQVIHGNVPIYDTVEKALKNHEAEASIVFVPAPFAADAAFEALKAGLKTLVIITEHIPVKDAVQDHYRTHPSEGRSASYGSRKTTRSSRYWPQHPRHHHTGRVQARDNACPHFQAGNRGHSLSKRNPNLRDCRGGF